jgi:hypothetical protein
MNAAGQTPQMIENLSGFGLHEAMTDGSKRQCSFEDDFDYECLDVSPAGKMGAHSKVGHQHPLVPSATSPINLPPGVTDLEDCGSTICKLPRVVKHRLSYVELAADVKNHGEYLQRILSHGKDRGSRLEDFHLSNSKSCSCGGELG